MPINKVVANAAEACKGIEDGMTLMVGGFGPVEFRRIVFPNWSTWA